MLRVIKSIKCQKLNGTFSRYELQQFFDRSSLGHQLNGDVYSEFLWFASNWRPEEYFDGFFSKERHLFLFNWKLWKLFEHASHTHQPLHTIDKIMIECWQYYAVMLEMRAFLWQFSVFIHNIFIMFTKTNLSNSIFYPCNRCLNDICFTPLFNEGLLLR